MQVRFGVFVPQGWRMDLTEIQDPIDKYEAMTRVAQTVDNLEAYDSIWVYDHFHTVPSPECEAVFECWTATAGLARDTRRVHVGQMVTCTAYRNPALLAKMASTVDVMSHGRLYCGIGAGWYEHEWRAYGYGYPETRARMRAFREATEIIMKMWTEDEPTYQGEYYSVQGPINEPKGVHKPHPPLWIGGGGEQVTLNLVARYGDACNVLGDAQVLRHKLDVLRRHCDAVGRDYDQIIRSTSLEDVLLVRQNERVEDAVGRTHNAMGIRFAGNAAQLGDYIQERVDAGINYFILSFPRIAYDQEQLHIFADEVVPRFRAQT